MKHLQIGAGIFTLATYNVQSHHLGTSTIDLSSTASGIGSPGILVSV